MATRKNKTARRSVPRRRATSRKVAHPWTREEIAFMRKYYRKYETSWIARQLGRTVYSVRYKASDLNIKKANPSVWKGNKGSKNAFNANTGRKTTRRRTSTNYRRNKTRRTTNKRRYNATSKRRNTRKATPRRRTRKTW